MRSPDEILALYAERTKYYSPLHAGMQVIKDIYEGTVRINLPDLDENPRPIVPNILGQGVDQLAGRIAQTVPTAWFSAERPNIRSSVRTARTAGQVVGGWWQSERLKLKMAQRARHLIAYGLSSVVVYWDDHLKRPVRQVRNPMETYPNPEVVNGTMIPVDCLYGYQRSVGYLIGKGYGPAVEAVTGRPLNLVGRDTMMRLIEYVDDEGRALLLTGMSAIDGASLVTFNTNPGAQRAKLIEYAPNKGGYCCSVVAARITLDRPMGMFTTMVGMYYHMSKLMALEALAVEKGIFPDTYLVGRTGELPRIVDGPYDGRTGKINVVTGGDIKDLQTVPGYMTPSTIDRLERAQRLTAGIPAELGGESGTNIRTARRGDSILATAIDFPVAEAQDLFAASLEDENRLGIALAKTYDGDNPRTIYVGGGNETRAVTYVANEVFPTSEHKVTYPVTGADVNAMLIGLEQRVGGGLLSKQTAMALDPWVADPEREHDRIIYEGLEQALVAGLQQRAAAGPENGGIDPVTIAQIMQTVVTDRAEVAEAVAKVAEAAAAQPPAVAGQNPTAEQMAAPSTAQSLTGSPVPGPTAGQQSLADLFGALRKPEAAQQAATR